MPPNTGALELLRFLLSEEIEIRERVLEVGASPSSRSDISAAQRLRCWIARVNLP